MTQPQFSSPRCAPGCSRALLLVPWGDLGDSLGSPGVFRGRPKTLSRRSWDGLGALLGANGVPGWLHRTPNDPPRSPLDRFWLFFEGLAAAVARKIVPPGRSPGPHRPSRIAQPASPWSHRPGRIALAASLWPHHSGLIWLPTNAPTLSLSTLPASHAPERLANIESSCLEPSIFIIKRVENLHILLSIF